VNIPGPWYSRFSTLSFVWYRMAGTSIVHTYGLFRRYGPIVCVQLDMVVVADDKVWDNVLRMGNNFRKAGFCGCIRIGPDRILFAITDESTIPRIDGFFACILMMDSLRWNWED